jgi:hypothetical protein
MPDFFDILHYLIGLVIVTILIAIIIKIHNYFSKDNIPSEILQVQNNSSTLLVK